MDKDCTGSTSYYERHHFHGGISQVIPKLWNQMGVIVSIKTPVLIGYMVLWSGCCREGRNQNPIL